MNNMDPKKIKLGISPIGWTNDDMPDLGGEITFEQCISEIALSGFTGCEIGNKFPKDTKLLKHMLDIRGVQVCNAWFSCYFTTKPYEETEKAFILHRDRLHALGAKIIGASEQGGTLQRSDTGIFSPDRPVMTDAQWETVTKGFEKLGRLAKEKGMEFTIHHHMGTSIQTAEEIDRLMDMTDPQYVSLLFDTGHLAFDGIDSLTVLKKHIGRIKHVHLKDVRKAMLRETIDKKYSFLHAVRKGVFSVPGDGDIVDFPAVFKELERAGYEGWMVVEAEGDPAVTNPFEYAVLTRKYIKATAGV